MVPMTTTSSPRDQKLVQLWHQHCCVHSQQQHLPLTEEQSQGSKNDAGTGEPSSERIANKTLPLKKRKVSEAFVEKEIEGKVSEEMEVTDYEEAQHIIPFKPVGREWQTRASHLFNMVVRNNHNDKINQRTIRSDTKPTQTVRMRGDGNCLFRTFS